MKPVIDGLTIVAEVGRGGFGTVYRAVDSRFGRDVAVKVIRDSGLGENLVARFERECRALGALSGHPNIVSVHDSGQTSDGDLYLVMEYLAGGSLADRMASQGRADPEEVAFWGTALSGALETAHRSDIVHRDVKPENVLFSEYGVLKLVDFGIARMRSAYETRSGFFSASLSHAAPEVVAGGSVSPAADVYSLASTLFYMLMGQAPFERQGEESLVPLIARISTSDPPDLRERGVPAALADVIETGLSKDPAARFGSAAGFGEALRDASTKMGNAPLPVPIGDSERIELAASVIAGERGDTPSDTIHGVRPDAVTPKTRSEEPADEPTPGARGRRRPLIFATAFVVVVLLAAGGFLGFSRYNAPPEADVADVAASEGPVKVIDTPLETEGVRIEREYAITAANQIGSSVSLTNTTTKRIERIWFEVIPKELADDAADVLFNRKPDKIVQADPIVYWKVPLRAGATRRISWSTPLPVAGSATAEYLNRAIALHRIAIESNEDVLADARRAAEKRGDGKAVRPDETVKDGGGKKADEDPHEVVIDPDDPRPNEPGPYPTPGGPGDPDPPPNRQPTVTVTDRKTNALVSVSFAIGATDPDGDTVSVSVSNLPPGVGVSGKQMSGSVRQDAATVTTNWRTLRSRNFTVTVVASDGRGGKTTKRFTWTVVDTHRLMPNYIGRYGCTDDPRQPNCPDPSTLPNVTHISAYRFGCVHDPNAPDRIRRQSVPAGHVIRRGQTITYWYGDSDGIDGDGNPCDAV